MRDAHLNRAVRAGHAERSRRRRRSERRRVPPLAASNGGARPRQPVPVRGRGRISLLWRPAVVSGMRRAGSTERDRVTGVAATTPRQNGDQPGLVRTSRCPCPGSPHARGSTPSRNLDGLPDASSPPSDATNGMEPDDGSLRRRLLRRSARRARDRRLRWQLRDGPRRSPSAHVSLERHASGGGPVETTYRRVTCEDPCTCP